ncbi:tetratricopeptide repeat protein [Psychromonas sp. KJ10-10]|uniref:tetratricopeptide repeat protein n=1 Tax=Psychromonas sp. KJ10-10 TaxID=3391823 RepID=UPI0039B59D1E
MTHYFSLLITSLLIAFSSSTFAIALIDGNIPEPLKEAYDGRYTTPYTCIDTTTRYIKTQRPFYENANLSSNKTTPLNENNILAEHLLAFCYAQIEEYQEAYKLLTNLLARQPFSMQQLRTHNIIASEIPEENRPELNNAILIKRLNINLQQINSPQLLGDTAIKAKLLLNISKLSLESNQYRNANIALESVKELLKNKKNTELSAWLFYYYGLYFEKINQEQLAIANLFSANELAEKEQLIKLSSETKKSIANLYQQKYLFKRAMNIAKQRVELFINTENRIKQADSLIQLAILNDKNNEKNNALIYLFNALELIQKDKHSNILAHVYLELGRTYSHYLTGRFVTNENHDKERLLAQKYLQNARYHFTRLGEVRYQIESLLLLAHLNISTEDPALAILQLENVLQLAQDNYPDLRVQAFDMLASSYEITGNHQQAILHFKNFHALQNNIKEHLFSLQQLQINEQLQLIELAQQQRQLEQENRSLKDSKDLFEATTYGALILLSIIILILLFFIVRNKNLFASNKQFERQLTLHPRTLLPSQQTQANHFDYIYNNDPLYYALVNIPFLTQLNELSGLFAGSKLEKNLV